MPSLREEGLVGAWDLGNPVNGIVYDLSGNGNNGTLMGGPILQLTPLGKSLRFDGVDDYATIANENNFDFTGDFTLEFLLRPTTSWGAAWKTIASKWAAAGSGWQLVWSNGQYLYLYVVNTIAVDTQGVFSTMRSNNWYHIVAVYRNNSVNSQIYVNGADVSANKNAVIAAANAVVPRIGSNAIGTTFSDASYISGAMYNRALTESEIRKHYFQAKTACWKTKYEGIAVSSADEGGIVGQYIGQTPFQCSDAVGRWRVETDIVNNVPNCKIIANRTALGVIGINTSIFQQNTTEAAFGSYKLYFNVPIASVLRWVLIGTANAAFNAANQTGYAVVIDGSVGVLALYRTLLGIVTQIYRSTNGVFTASTWNELIVERTNSCVFTVKLNGNITPVFVGSNPVTDSSYVLSEWQSLEGSGAIGSRIVFASPNSNLCIRKGII